jgi:hypothetical protein
VDENDVLLPPRSDADDSPQVGLTSGGAADMLAQIEAEMKKLEAGGYLARTTDAAGEDTTFAKQDEMRITPSEELKPYSAHRFAQLDAEMEKLQADSAEAGDSAILGNEAGCFEAAQVFCENVESANSLNRNVDGTAQLASPSSQGECIRADLSSAASILKASEAVFEDGERRSLPSHMEEDSPTPEDSPAPNGEEEEEAQVNDAALLPQSRADGQPSPVARASLALAGETDDATSGSPELSDQQKWAAWARAAAVAAEAAVSAAAT